MQENLVAFMDKAIKLAKPNEFEIEGKKYTDKTLTMVYAPDDYAPGSINLGTLSGLVDFLKSDTCDIKPTDATICVVNPKHVKVVSVMKGNYKNRFIYADTKHDAFEFEFGRKYGYEDFIIKLQTQFVFNENGGDVQKLSDFVSKVSDIREDSVEDDGISQQVLQKAGLVSKAEAKVKNPVRLAPKNVFPEINPPVTSFVFRIGKCRDDLDFALYSADIGQWNLQAVELVANWLKDRLEGWAIIS